MVPADKNSTKVVPDQEKIGNRCIRETRVAPSMASASFMRRPRTRKWNRSLFTFSPFTAKSHLLHFVYDQLYCAIVNNKPAPASQ